MRKLAHWGDRHRGDPRRCRVPATVSVPAPGPTGTRCSRWPQTRCRACRRQHAKPPASARCSTGSTRTGATTSRRSQRRRRTGATTFPSMTTRRPTSPAPSRRRLPHQRRSAQDPLLPQSHGPAGHLPVPKKDWMGMDYIPVYEGEEDDGSTVKVSLDKVQRSGVRTEEAHAPNPVAARPRARHRQARRAHAAHRSRSGPTASSRSSTSTRPAST